MYRDGLRNKAIELGYSDANLCIIDGDVGLLGERHPRTIENLKSCIHNADSRSVIDYGRDLVASWIFEDTMVQLLNSHGIKTVLSGTDRNREILGKMTISSCSDCIVSYCGTERHLEIVSDYTRWWETTGHMELRDSKYTKLRSEKSLLLGICTTSGKYTLLDFSQPVSAKYIQSHRNYGGKPAWSIKIKKEELKKFSVPHLVNHIKCFLTDF